MITRRAHSSTWHFSSATGRTRRAPEVGRELRMQRAQTTAIYAYEAVADRLGRNSWAKLGDENSAHKKLQPRRGVAHSANPDRCAIAAKAIAPFPDIAHLQTIAAAGWALTWYCPACGQIWAWPGVSTRIPTNQESGL